MKKVLLFLLGVIFIFVLLAIVNYYLGDNFYSFDFKRIFTRIDNIFAVIPTRIEFFTDALKDLTNINNFTSFFSISSDFLRDFLNYTMSCIDMPQYVEVSWEGLTRIGEAIGALWNNTKEFLLYAGSFMGLIFDAHWYELLFIFIQEWGVDVINAFSNFFYYIGNLLTAFVDICTSPFVVLVEFLQLPFYSGS